MGLTWNSSEATSEAKTSWVNDSVDGKKRFTFSLAPKNMGETTIPSVYFSYFDPSKKSYETISLNPLTVRLNSQRLGTVSPPSVSGGTPALVILLDVSGSMLAEDLQPGNRLEVAKTVLKEFFSAKPKARAGIKVFAREVVTAAPLTEPTQTLLGEIDRIQIGVIKDGTALGDALLEAVKELKSKRSQENTVVLLSDGANNAGHIDPFTAADFAQENNIVVYSVGLGKQGLVPFPIDDPQFGKRRIMTEANVDSDTLTEIANITGGKYFKADETVQLGDIFREINNTLRS